MPSDPNNISFEDFTRFQPARTEGLRLLPLCSSTLSENKPLQNQFDGIRYLVTKSIRRLLSEEDRDPYSPTFGCFDRRYWGWKLVDFPEITFQRNVYPLAWLYEHPYPGFDVAPDILIQSAQAGLRYAICMQHADGSFDQSFPNEHSFGATAFLLYPLLKTYEILRETIVPELRQTLEASLKKASNFLCHHDERHGYIANHLAGAALALRASANFFGKPCYAERADELLIRILERQSPEGWFLEYEGADPGYQTLCLFYLARIYRLCPSPRLREALARAIAFLVCFAHPDGTFGGEYGSRRTAVLYPGGMALLNNDFPLAQSLMRFALNAISTGSAITLQDIDMGNLAPLLTNYIAVLDGSIPEATQPTLPLPCEQDGFERNFPEAGLYIRSTQKYYTIFSACNGGVLKVFDRLKHTAVWNDGGYVGQTTTGKYLTTQITDLNRPCEASPEKIRMETAFYAMPRLIPTPPRFIILRLLNLTLMRSMTIGNLIKKCLVLLLINRKRPGQLRLERVIEFDQEKVTVKDTLTMKGPLVLRWLEYGRPFVAIHMASAKYYEGGAGNTFWPQRCIDVIALQSAGKLEQTVII